MSIEFKTAYEFCFCKTKAVSRLLDSQLISGLVFTSLLILIFMSADITRELEAYNAFSSTYVDVVAKSPEISSSVVPSNIKSAPSAQISSQVTTTRFDVLKDKQNTEDAVKEAETVLKVAKPSSMFLAVVLLLCLVSLSTVIPIAKKDTEDLKVTLISYKLSAKSINKIMLYIKTITYALPFTFGAMCVSIIIEKGGLLL